MGRGIERVVLSLCIHKSGQEKLQKLLFCWKKEKKKALGVSTLPGESRQSRKTLKEGAGGAVHGT